MAAMHLESKLQFHLITVTGFPHFLYKKSEPQQTARGFDISMWTLEISESLHFFHRGFDKSEIGNPGNLEKSAEIPGEINPSTILGIPKKRNSRGILEFSIFIPG
jgi:hypothetical protein